MVCLMAWFVPFACMNFKLKGGTDYLDIDLLGHPLIKPTVIAALLRMIICCLWLSNNPTIYRPGGNSFQEVLLA